jgi:hypothetical protein
MPDSQTSDVSLLAYFERLLADHERWAVSKFDAQDRALSLARDIDERKHHDLNELRKEVIQDRSQYIQLSVYETRHEMVLRELTLLHKQVDILEARISTWIAAIAAFVLLLQGVAHYIWGK